MWQGAAEHQGRAGADRRPLSQVRRSLRPVLRAAGLTLWLIVCLPAWANAQPCAILWESGPVRLEAEFSPQALRMEWRLSYCPGTHYSATMRVPGRIKLEGRMDGAGWQEAVSETVPDGLQQIAPDRNPGGTWGGGNYDCC